MLIEDFNDSKKLVIVFPGLNGKINSPDNIFFLSAGLANYNKIIIYDRTLCLTLSGIDSFFSSFNEMIYYLKTKSKKYKEILVTGNSGGGFTAILVGYLINADKVVAFAPYTYLDRETVILRNDPGILSMKRIFNKIENIKDPIDKFKNLNNLLEFYNGKTKFYIHVSRFNKWDSRRASELLGKPGVKIFYHPFKSHAIISSLVNSGLLSSCFNNNLFSYNKNRKKLVIEIFNDLIYKELSRFVFKFKSKVKRLFRLNIK
ncbi:MAG: hypothetical protein P8O16_17320 [Algoriphagus sp.]|uniref:hypothetical protein n=1 Tax=Algoriphagus sp. TaxID=1872435 RepID=UPI00262FB688|nr:hypothetical protein [Algoriphagus sp.]MDG1279043.1 hypothetical protein [Algoriphagus sp.]